MIDKLIIYTLYIIITSFDFKVILTVFVTALSLPTIIIFAWKMVAKRIAERS
jgi:hypothetical protein